MVSFTSNLEVMTRVGEQQHKTFREWYEIQKRDVTPTNIFNTNGSFNKVRNNQFAKLNKKMPLRIIFKLF